LVSHSQIDMLLENTESGTHFNDYIVYDTVIRNNNARYPY